MQDVEEKTRVFLLQDMVCVRCVCHVCVIKQDYYYICLSRQ